MELDDIFEEDETFETDSIKEVRARLEQAVKSKAVELKEKYGVEDFKDESFGKIDSLIKFNSGIGGFLFYGYINSVRNSNDLDLFFHLVERKNILGNDDIDLYVAKVLVDYAKKIKDEFRKLDNGYGYDLSEKLLKEAEDLLSKPFKRPFERAYQCYLLGTIEHSRAGIVVGQNPGKDKPDEVRKKIDYHNKRAARFLEEALYHNKELKEVRFELFHAYSSLVECGSAEEKEAFKERFDRFNASYPKYYENWSRFRDTIKKAAEERKRMNQAK